MLLLDECAGVLSPVLTFIQVFSKQELQGVVDLQMKIVACRGSF